MAQQKQQPDDPYHDDGVYTGPGVPMSVFYKAKRPPVCQSFKKPHEVATQLEAEQRQLKRLQKRESNARRRKRWPR